jgi:hypothetical protein
VRQGAVKRLIGGEQVWLAVPSSGRPGNVAAMTSLVGPATWYTHPGQAADYRAVHAPQIRETAGYPGNVQAALDEGHRLGWPVVVVDDDLVRVRRRVTGRNEDAVPVEFAEAVGETLGDLRRTDFRLAGGPPTDNAFYSSDGNSTSLFIRGGLWVVLPNECRIDTRLPLKYDYDYCVQHHQRYGGMLRVNRYLWTFRQRTNSGGCQEYRTPAAEEAACRYLVEKWPGLVARHATRRHEVTLRLPSLRKVRL